MAISAFFDDVIEENYDVNLPILILKELVQELEIKTKGLLIGNIVKELRGTYIRLTFDIRAPSLNNYGYTVFTLIHDLVSFYPLKISVSNNPILEVQNQEDLEKELKIIFLSPEVKKVINGLLAQVKAA